MVFGWKRYWTQYLVPAMFNSLLTDLFKHSGGPTQHFLFSQGLVCSNIKVLMLTANSLKTSSTEQPSQVCVCVCVSISEHPGITTPTTPSNTQM